jgi:hypothetical protein
MRGDRRWGGWEKTRVLAFLGVLWRGRRVGGAAETRNRESGLGL